MDANAATQRVTFRSHEDFDLVGDAWGNPDDPPVVFLPGGGQTRHAWGNTARVVSEQGFYAISMDARGHGDSGWSPQAKYQLVDFVDDLRAVCEQLPRAPIVVGASLGGMTGLVAAGGEDAVELAGLILVDIAPQMEAEGVERVINFMTAAPEGFASLEEAADAVAGYLPHRERPKDLSGLSKNLRQDESGRYQWHWDPGFMNLKQGRRLQEAPMTRAAERLRIPTLLVRGRMSDVLSPEGAEAFLETVPHARFADVSGAGHMVAGDQNDPFTEAVIRFLSDTFAG